MPNGRAGCGWFRRPTAPAAAAVRRSSLQPLDIGADVELVRPAVPRLVVQCPVGFGDRAGLDQAVRRRIGDCPGCGAEPPVNSLTVDRAVDDQMDDMDVLWCKLARHGLCDPAQAELRRREGGEAGAAANAGSGASEQDGAATARHHVARRFTASQEAAVTGELPCLE